jgi:gas vesicle protein
MTNTKKGTAKEKGTGSNHDGLKIGLEIGAAVVAAGVAAYFLTGERGKENRKKIADWAQTAKDEVLDKVNQLKELNQDIYNKIIDSVAARYEILKHVEKGELESLVRDLKGRWSEISKKAKEGAGGKKASASKKK